MTSTAPSLTRYETLRVIAKALSKMEQATGHAADLERQLQLGVIRVACYKLGDAVVADRAIAAVRRRDWLAAIDLKQGLGALAAYDARRAA